MNFYNQKHKGRITLHEGGAVMDSPIPLVDYVSADADDKFDDYPKAASSNAQKVLDWIEENGNPNDCLTAVGFARANQLAKGEAVSFDVVKRMAAFVRHEQHKDVPYEEGCGGMAWDAWGGDEGIAWAIRTVNRVNEEEESEQAKQSNARESFRSTFRPQEAPENIAIDPEQVLLVPFRLISATTVGANSYKATYFPAEVLEASMPLLINKPIYRNHDMDPDCWLGVVQAVEWGRSYLQGTTEIPAGINGMLAIDTQNEANAELARGIVMQAVRSNSVTVEFEWIPSHQFEFDFQFWDALGTMVDGRMVTRVVTNILDYHETSIVGLGADPFAKLIGDNGELIDIDLANAVPDPINNTMFEREEQRIEMRAKAKAESFSIKIEPIKFLKSENMAEKKEFATVFGTALNDAITNLCDSKKLGRGEVVKRMAEAAGVSVRTVQLYVSGQNACPKLEYLDKFAGVLLVGTKQLYDAAVEGGCTYSKGDLEQYLGSFGNKEDEEEMEDHKEEDEEEMAKVSAEDSDDVEDDEEEMAKVSASIEPNPMELMMQKLEELTKQVAELQKPTIEAVAETEPKTEVIENTTENPQTEEVEEVENIAEAESFEQEDKKEDEGEENEAEAGKLMKETESEVVKEFKTLTETYKREASDAKVELEATKKAFQQKQNENADRIATLRAELEDLRATLTQTREEKAALELENSDASELRLQLKQEQKRANELTEMVESYRENEHFAQAGKAHFEAMKSEAIRLYNAKVGAEASEAVVQLFENAKTLEAVKGLVQQYGKELTAEFAVKCSDCGSQNCDFGSVIVGYEQSDVYVDEPVLGDDAFREQLQWRK